MKIKQKLLTITASIGIVATFSMNTGYVSAKTNANYFTLYHSDNYWKKWRKVVLTQNTTFTQIPKDLDSYIIDYGEHYPLTNIRLRQGTIFYAKIAKSIHGKYWIYKSKDLKENSNMYWSLDDKNVDFDYTPGFAIATSNNIKQNRVSGTVPTPIITTKPIKIWKEKLAKYHYKVRAVGKNKTLKKGTKMNILWGGMGFNWILLKSGYTHSGLTIKNNLKSHGYVLVVSKSYTDTSWFKLQSSRQNDVIKKWTSRE